MAAQVVAAHEAVAVELVAHALDNALDTLFPGGGKQAGSAEPKVTVAGEASFHSLLHQAAMEQQAAVTQRSPAEPVGTSPAEPADASRPPLVPTRSKGTLAKAKSANHLLSLHGSASGPPMGLVSLSQGGSTRKSMPEQGSTRERASTEASDAGDVGVAPLPFLPKAVLPKALSMALGPNVALPDKRPSLFSMASHVGELRTSSFAAPERELLNTIDGTTVPLLVFVNARSGGGMGKELLSRFQAWLGKEQVVDLGRVGRGGATPEEVLARFCTVEQARVLVCGGDGTCSWILAAMDAVCHLQAVEPLPMAVMPLGTGNDLARALGWGAGFHTSMAQRAWLRKVANAVPASLDRWSITLEACDGLPTQVPLPLPLPPQTTDATECHRSPLTDCSSAASCSSGRSRTRGGPRRCAVESYATTLASASRRPDCTPSTSHGRRRRTNSSRG